MGLPKSVRFDHELESLVAEYLRQNNLKFSQLIQMAILKFISETQSIELKPVSSKKWKQTFESAFLRHKDAMDKLK